MKLKTIFIVIAIVIAFIIPATIDPLSEIPHAGAGDIDAFKTALNPVGFKGVVTDKGGFDYSHRGWSSIELKVDGIQNEQSVPAGCRFFTYKKGVIKFAAYSETVNRWPDYGLEEGYIVEKRINNDTIFVYSPDNKPKYVFELFDGLDSDWVARQSPQ